MSNRTEEFDVVVVGASLAGCTAATLFARQGLRVALADKHSGPTAYKRLCGHYIQASARPVIERLGLAETIERAGGVRNGVDVWTRFGVVARPNGFGEAPFGYSIRRAKLDPAIREIAAETEGVEYLPRHELTNLLGDERRANGVELRDRDGSTLRLSSRLVVGADGRNSKVAQLSAARTDRADNQRFCYMAYFTGVGLPASPGGRVWTLDPDVAIASPNDDDHTVLAAFVHKRRLREFQTDRAGTLRRFFAALPEPPELRSAQLAGKVVGYKDYGIVARDQYPRAGVALVGDAALTCDPVMAIGCGWALQSAEWLADAAAPALVAGQACDRALREYRRVHRKRLRPHHRMLSMDAKARPMNPVQRMLFAAAARDPKTAERFHRYAERSIAPRELLSPRSLGRAARVCLSR